jgi:glycosyltransferase involved in cell wall biosynthesis
MAYPQNGFMEKVLDGRVGNKVFRFITASKAAGNSLVNERKFSRQKLINIPNTLPYETELKLPQIAGHLKAEFKLTDDMLILGAVGLLTNRKGFHVLIDAVHLVRKTYGDVLPFKLFIFGEGEDRTRLETKIHKLGLESIVFLPGFRNKILNYVKDFDIFLAPSLSNEDFPYVILEAMALSKPVIGTNVAGIPEQIDNNETGFIVPEGNPEQLSDAIGKLISNRERIRYMGNSGYLKYRKSFGNETIMGQYLDLFNSLSK